MAGMVEDPKIAALLRDKISELEKDTKLSSTGGKNKKNPAKSQSKTKLKKSKEIFDDPTLGFDEKVKQLESQARKELEECTNLASELKEARGRVSEAENEKEASWGELNKTLKTKTKLESLCAELQKVQKTLLDENRRITEQERSRRQELADKFQWTIRDVREKMDQQAQDRLQQVKENDDLRRKFKKFLEQYEEREKELIEQQKRRELETQMVGLRLAEQEKLYKQEAQKLQVCSQEYQTLSSSESLLNSQLKTYGEKFHHFQDTLSKSNKVFEQYKRERNRLQRKVEALEKENGGLREKVNKKMASCNRDGHKTLMSELNELQEESKTLMAEKKTLTDEIEKLKG